MSTSEKSLRKEGDGARRRVLPLADLLRTSLLDTYSGSMKITTRLDHISHRENRRIQIGRMDGPSEYLLKILAAIISEALLCFNLSGRTTLVGPG